MPGDKNFGKKQDDTLENRVLSVKNKDEALVCIKELAKKIDEKSEFGDMVYLVELKKLMQKFEITEMDVNKILGREFLASGGGYFEGENKTRPREIPYPKGEKFFPGK